MSADAQGFLYPLVDRLRCTECGVCRKTCPVIDRVTRAGVPVSYACLAEDDAIREASSSGGIFTLLAERVIEDGGVVFGAVFTEDLRVVHQSTESREGLGRLRGSKYVQSEIGSTYTEVAALLDDGRHVLFSGTPCQVEGLKSLLGKTSGSLLCVDFVCHGVPSPLVWRQYVSFQEKEHGAPVRAVSFRDKSAGWRNYALRLEFNNGDVYRQTLALDPYMMAFLRDICLRPSCYECRFKGLSRDSDITLADFWGIDHVLPGMDDDKGISFVMVNSELGRAAFSNVQSRIACEPIETGLAVEHNGAAIRSAERHPGYSTFFRDMPRLPFDRLVEKHCGASLISRVRRLLLRIARRVRHQSHGLSEGNDRGA